MATMDDFTAGDRICVVSTVESLLLGANLSIGDTGHVVGMSYETGRVKICVRDSTWYVMPGAIARVNIEFDCEHAKRGRVAAVKELRNWARCAGVNLSLLEAKNMCYAIGDAFIETSDRTKDYDQLRAMHDELTTRYNDLLEVLTRDQLTSLLRR